MFAPLHLKSAYSLGFGCAGIDELVRRAARLGYRSLALTDLENLYGQVRFQHHCRQHGIHPICGLELRTGHQVPTLAGCVQGRLVLLALDEAGYGSLCSIVSQRRSAPRRPSSDPLPLLREHGEGVLALSDDPSVIERLLQERAIPPQRLALLLLRPAPHFTVPASTLSFFTSRDVSLVADLDTVFLFPADHALHTLQHAIAKGITCAEAAATFDLESPERWLRTPAQVKNLFADVPEALAGSARLAELCQFELDGRAGLHAFGFGTAEEDHRELSRLCLAALQGKRVGQGGGDVYRQRLAAELDVYGRLGFSGYMLGVVAILQYCESEGIPVAVRGSAVSSLVLHLLGGSPVDPVRQGLLFERFLHEGKSAWPDVDIDLPWHRRDEVIAWVYRHFGADRVAMVATHHGFQLRSALRLGLKALGVPAEIIEQLARKAPLERDEARAADLLDLGTDQSRSNTGELSGAELPPGIRDLLPLVRRLVGLPRHVAVHPGGIVIDRQPLAHRLPLERAAKGVVMTQYDLLSVAQLGFVKMDLLGNRCLSEIMETLTLAGYLEPVRLSAIPEEDRATLDLIDAAKTVGCFQLESPAMRTLLARLPIRHQSDLTAALALIRPGAASGAVKESFVRRARGEERVLLAFPALADRLAESYGLPIYEEDIMVLLHRFGGVSLAEADEMRRGIVKCGGDPQTLTALEAEFFARSRRSSGGVGREVALATRAWQVAARFAAYSFNKAHAASYALLAYYSAYLKTHHPVEFACAVLNHHQGLYPLRIVASEFTRMGIAVLAPHVDRSRYHSVLEAAGGAVAVRVGLDKVKRLSQRAAGELVAERERMGAFASVAELLARVRLSVGEIEALVLCGACDGLSPLAPGLYPFPHEAVVAWLRQGGDPAEVGSVSYGRAVAESADEIDRLQLFRALVRARNELAFLEMHLSAHPVGLLRREAERVGCARIREVVSTGREGRVRVAAVVGAMRRVATRHGTLLFLTLEDESGLMEAVLPPARYGDLAAEVSTPGPFLVEGRLSWQQGAPQFEVEGLRPLHRRSRG